MEPETAPHTLELRRSLQAAEVHRAPYSLPPPHTHTPYLAPRPPPPPAPAQLQPHHLCWDFLSNFPFKTIDFPPIVLHMRS